MTQSEKLSTEEISGVEFVILPSRWKLRSKTRVGQLTCLKDPEAHWPGKLEPSRIGSAEHREFLFTGADNIQITISIGTPSKVASKHLWVVHAKSVSLAGPVLHLDEKATWRSHPEQLDCDIEALSKERDTVIRSWRDGIIYRSDKAGTGGLRTPQIGALHAIAAHWSISLKAGIVVMPTGTGKTEVMVATMLGAQCRSVLVVVPSDALRSQTAQKFETLGVLRTIGVVPSQFMFPIVGTLRCVPKDDKELKLFDCCNVVVATMSALSGASGEILDKIASRCTHLFIDEAHHTPAETWNDLRERFAERAILQFTATPFRRDGRRMEGQVIYNYPLAKAQTEGYFRPIHFEEVWDWDRTTADNSIAAAGLKRLRADLAANLDHMLMARADSIARAQALFDSIYSKHPDLNPIVIHNKTPNRRQVLAAIKQRQHRVIVCVDMLGEGFDLPQLKIAALHDAHRSLGVTLQFAGRFTRTSQGIGDATVVANLADRKISESLEELYSEDADWNLLLQSLSYDAIRPQLNLSEFVRDLQSSIPTGEPELLSAATIEPKTSTIIYEADHFRPDDFRSGLTRDADVLCWWKNAPQKLLVFIVRRPEELGWARTKDVTHQIYDLYITFYDSTRQLLFIHSSVKGTHLRLATAIGGKVMQVQGEKMFRVLSGIQRIVFYNAGLLRGKRGAVRFQMFSGLDVAKAIDPVEQQEATKSNLFGSGYENGKRITIGCSQKGTVWSLQTCSIPEWRAWCLQIGAKILNNAIRTDEYLDHTMVPEQIELLPFERPICIEWPSFIFERITQQLEFLRDDRAISWLDCGLNLSGWTENNFEFTVNFPDGTTARLQCKLSDDRPLCVEEVSAPATFVRSKDLKQSLVQFFEDHPPLLRFSSGAELAGNMLLNPKTVSSHQFSLDALIVQDWTGVDLKCESQWKHGNYRSQAVQCFVVKQLLRDSNSAVIVDDDDSGEAADVLAVRQTNDRIEVHFYHCKYASSVTPGSRVEDLYVAFGQAQKGVMWTLDFNRLVDHLIHRENNSRNGRPSRFEQGSLKDLYRLQRQSRKIPIEYHVTVVQPGLSKAALKPEHSSVLGATSLFIRQRLGTSLHAWVSA